MALFEFELANVEDIQPWQGAEGPSLSWFALTDGVFCMPVGDRVLFEYSDEIMAHWDTRIRKPIPGVSRYSADYQIAAFVREILGSVAAAMARLPARIERLASSWAALTELRRRTEEVEDSEKDDELGYAAWRWLGERSPWASYLVACPNFQLVRIGDELRIHWDNRERVVDGIQVWTAEQGTYSMDVVEFGNECRGFAGRLLHEMELRITAIEQGAAQPRAAVNVASLRKQHETWRAEFDSAFTRVYQPDIDWQEAERALEVIANRCGVSF